MLFHPKINRDYKPPRFVERKLDYTEEYGPEEVESREPNSAQQIIYEDENEQKSSSNRIKVSKVISEKSLYKEE